MTTVIIKDQKLPAFLPHGWKQAVARDLGVHYNTICKHIKRGHGQFYDKIVKAATARYGVGTNVTMDS